MCHRLADQKCLPSLRKVVHLERDGMEKLYKLEDSFMNECFFNSEWQGHEVLKNINNYQKI